MELLPREIVPDAEQLAAIFSHAAAPAFLLAGVGGFTSLLLGRLSVVVDRIRDLRDIDDADAVRGRHKHEIPGLKRRATLLHRSALLAVFAGISTTLLLIVSVACAFLKVQHLYGGGLLFGAAASFFTLSLIFFAQEIKLALRELGEF